MKDVQFNIRRQYRLAKSRISRPILAPSNHHAITASTLKSVLCEIKCRSNKKCFTFYLKSSVFSLRFPSKNR